MCYINHSTWGNMLVIGQKVENFYVMGSKKWPKLKVLLSETSGRLHFSVLSYFNKPNLVHLRFWSVLFKHSTEVFQEVELSKSLQVRTVTDAQNLAIIFCLKRILTFLTVWLSDYLSCDFWLPSDFLSAFWLTDYQTFWISDL